MPSTLSGRALLSRRAFLRDGLVVAGGAFWMERGGAALGAEPAAATGIAATRCEGLGEFLGLQTASPRLSWSFGECSGGLRQVAYQLAVSSERGGAPDLWDSGRVVSEAVSVEYAGKPVAAHRQAFWQVRGWFSDGTVSGWSEPARWSTGPGGEQDWAGSRWIARDVLLEDTQGSMPGSPGTPGEPNYFPAPYLRKEFDLRTPVRAAMLYVCGLGYAECYVNGSRLGNGTEREPGFSNYDDRVLYVTYDVSSLLREKENAVGVILGTGWYDVHDVATWHFNTAPWRERPRVRVTLALQLADGTTEFVISDQSWRCAAGPILRDGIYTGEVYDARREMSGWSEAHFDAGTWTRALVVEGPRGRLVAQSCPPIRVTETITPVAISEPQPGVFIVNMGQNFSGHTQLRVKGPGGHAITMRYGEILGKDGMLDTRPIDHFMMKSEPRQPFQQDTYICKGSGELEVWEQRFSYSGFQYVEVTNFPGTPTLDNFRGRFAHTDLVSAGEFFCSNEIANRIQHATLWSYQSNAQSYPTDCPQREKNGWTGDAGIAVECGLLNFDSAAFYGKWLEDLSDAQRPDGGLPVIVPNGGWGNGEHWPGALCPPWDAAYLLIVWNVYRYTGERGVLRLHVEKIQRYVDLFLAQRGSSGLAPGLGLGDWFTWKTETPLDFITNAYLYLDLSLLAKMYEVLGEVTSAARVRTTSVELALKIQRAFYHPETHLYANGSQAAQSIALSFGLVPAGEEAGVFAAMAAGVERLGHIDAGILGARNLLRALSAGGRTDLAFHIATQTEMPGWGYWAKVGATTLWEGWEAGPSYNHIMFGDISAWFYTWIAGIGQAADSVGFERIVFQPNPVGDLTSARASYNTPRGKVSSDWTVSGKRMQLSVMIPCGATARLVLPPAARFSPGKGRSAHAVPSPGGEPGNILASGRHEFEILLG